MKNTPLVSVAIPYYNDAAFLKESIESVLNQTYSNLEIILINHASTDDSRKIARSYDDVRIKHIDMPENNGSGGGLLLKAFLSKATGTYTKLFCADDIMLPNCIERLCKTMIFSSDIGMVFADMQYIDKNGKMLKDTFKTKVPEFYRIHTTVDALKYLINGYSIFPFSSSFVKTELLSSILKNLSMSLIQLYDMSIWVNLLIRNVSYKIVDEILVCYRQHEGQMSELNTSRGLEIAGRRSWFEAQIYYPIFFRMRDVRMVREICSEVPFVSKLRSRSMIPFIVAYFFMTSSLPEHQVIGYIKMHSLVQNSVSRFEILHIFSFSMRDFRRLYSLGSASNNDLILSKTNPNLKTIILCIYRKIINIDIRKIKNVFFKTHKKILNKPVYQMSFLQLLYLLFYSISKTLFRFKRHG